MQQPSPPPRITMSTIWYSVLDIFNIEKGLIYSLIALTTHPGRAIRTYLYEDRSRLMPPFRLLILTVAIGTFITIQYFKSNSFLDTIQPALKDNGIERSADAEAKYQVFLSGLSDIFNNYFNIFILLGVPVIALSTFWVFRRKMNYAEHLVVNSYFTAYATLIYIALSPLMWWKDYWFVSAFYFIFSVLYSVFLYIQVFQLKLLPGIFKTLLATLLYYSIYYLFFIIVAFIVIAIYLAK